METKNVYDQKHMKYNKPFEYNNESIKSYKPESVEYTTPYNDPFDKLGEDLDDYYYELEPETNEYTTPTPPITTKADPKRGLRDPYDPRLANWNLVMCFKGKSGFRNLFRAIYGYKR